TNADRRDSRIKDHRGSKKVTPSGCACPLSGRRPAIGACNIRLPQPPPTFYARPELSACDPKSAFTPAFWPCCWGTGHGIDQKGGRRLPGRGNARGLRG